jgi:nicotinamidase-related amidase
MKKGRLPLPPHFAPERIGEIWRPDHGELAAAAEAWAKRHGLRPAKDDAPKISLLAVDVQNSFCIPGYELFVAGPSGRGAIDDNRRLCEFVYRNLGLLSQICPTMDTHHPFQIFHPSFWIDAHGEHPRPFTLVSTEDLDRLRWRVDPRVSSVLGLDEAFLERYVRHYARALAEGGKYDLTIWPYHAILGSPGHALVPAVEEAVFFHAIARQAQPAFQVKGDHPLTEHYSVLGPEILAGPEGEPVAERSEAFVDRLLRSDAVVVAGQAKSHCVAWTIADLLQDITLRDRHLAEKVYLLEDCTSPVVVPGAMDYSKEADAAFRRFEDAGMHVVRSTDPIESWPNAPL